MILSTQYYRPPFPDDSRWEEDLALIASTGFDSIYLSACWSWVEAQPGAYRFEDYDRLIELAGRNKLAVTVNLWSEVQPVWMHRLHPDAAMIDHTGAEVHSSQLAYMQFGLTPGCCTDHPQVRSRAAAFLSAFARRYASSPAIAAWDCWNEMRWMSQADGYVCFCEHTVERYRAWLKQRYGTLDELNRAWRRRYVDWADVAPAKAPARTYTDALQWQQFITERTAQELRWRYECVRAEDPQRQIIAHAAFPSVHNTGEYFEYETALGRGNDWELARQVDGYGCSHFPQWFHPSPADYGARIESVRCATGDKPYWIAELQGGAAGHGVQAMPPVTGAQQARWIWSGVARGAKAVNFWCWRDEVFSRESGGFGIVGDDGHRADRLQELQRTAGLFREYERLLDAYRPLPARVGVVFEPITYQFDWASHAAGGLAPLKDAPYRAGYSVQGYLRALERLQVPYDVVEPSFTDSLGRYRLLILPYPLIVDRQLPPRLCEWVKSGGTLLVEASLDAFDDAGLFTYPRERSLPEQLGLAFSARRPLAEPTLSFEVEGRRIELKCSRWREEIASAANDAPRPMQMCSLGEGRVIAVGSFVGLAYSEQRYREFEQFLDLLVNAAEAAPELRCSLRDGEVVQWRLGYSGEAALLFLINHGAQTSVEFECADERVRAARTAVDLTSRSSVTRVRDGRAMRLGISLAEGGYHVVRFDRQ